MPRFVPRLPSGGACPDPRRRAGSQGRERASAVRKEKRQTRCLEGADGPEGRGGKRPVRPVDRRTTVSGVQIWANLGIEDPTRRAEDRSVMEAVSTTPRGARRRPGQAGMNSAWGGGRG